MLLHDVTGLNAPFRMVAERLARLGFLVVAPDLYARLGDEPALPDTVPGVRAGRERAARLERDAMLRDVLAAAAHAGHPRLAVLGYGLGGDAAWLAATESAAFRAAVCYYPPHAADHPTAPMCPVQMHFASFDPEIPSASIERLRTAHAELDVHVHPDTYNRFACEASESFSTMGAERAEESMLCFLRRHLGA